MLERPREHDRSVISSIVALSYFVSTIHRQCSACVIDPPWFYETHVFEWDCTTRKSGKWTHECSENADDEELGLAHHFEVCRKLAMGESLDLDMPSPPTPVNDFDATFDSHPPTPRDPDPLTDAEIQEMSRSKAEPRDEPFFLHAAIDREREYLYKSRRYTGCTIKALLCVGGELGKLNEDTPVILRPNGDIHYLDDSGAICKEPAFEVVAETNDGESITGLYDGPLDP